MIIDFRFIGIQMLHSHFLVVCCMCTFVLCFCARCIPIRMHIAVSILLLLLFYRNLHFGIWCQIISGVCRGAKKKSEIRKMTATECK